MRERISHILIALSAIVAVVSFAIYYQIALYYHPQSPPDWATNHLMRDGYFFSACVGFLGVSMLLKKGVVRLMVYVASFFFGYILFLFWLKDICPETIVMNKGVTAITLTILSCSILLPIARKWLK